ncbi:MAG: helix-turn-helix domain-containing protein, partial [Promethearchaeota archaeon]
MYNFIEKTPYHMESIRDFCKCFLGLNDSDTDVFFSIRKNPDSTCEEISHHVKKSRSLVQRSLKKLLEEKLIERRSVNVQGENKRGFVYQYRARDPELVRSYLLERAKEMFN